MQLPDISPRLSFLITASLVSENDQPILYNGDWKDLSDLARWHQVEALLYDYIERSQAKVPEEILSPIKDRSVNQAVYNMIVLQKAIALSAALSENHVDTFLMKGPLWAWMFYKKPGLRDFGDLDFFIKRKDIQASLSVFSAFGFEPDTYRKYLMSDPHVADLYLDTDYQLPLTPVEDGILRSLEIQWRSTYPRYHYDLSWEALTKDRISFPVLHASLLVPSVDNQLLMMIVHHAGVEQWDKLKYMTDLVLLLRKFSKVINWQEVVQVSKNKGFYRLLLESLGLVKLLTGENYLQCCETGLENKYPSKVFSEKVFKHWENKRTKPTTKSWQIFYFNMLYRDRLSDRLAIAWSHLAYLLEWRLIIPKIRWYNRRAKQV